MVRIMSIHKSKGLEFPVVFLCGCGKGINFRDLNDKILLHQDIGFGPKYINYERQIEYNTLAKEAIKEISKKETISEEMRVLYVALTRAKEKLIMIGTSKDVQKQIDEKKELLSNIQDEGKLPAQLVKRYKTYLDWLELVYLRNNNEALNMFICTKQELENNKKQEEIKPIKEYEIPEQLKNELKEKIEWQYPKKELSNIPSKSSVTKIKDIHSYGKEYELDEDLDCVLETPQFLSEQKGLTGAQKGTVMHFVLQKIDLKRDYTIQELREFISELVAKKLLTDKEAQTVKIDKIKSFLDSDLAKDIRQAKEIYQEKPFYLYVPAKEIYNISEEEKIVVQGIIDLYYRNKEGKLILVDYKTDFVENKDKNVLIQKYGKQIECYKKAIEQGTKEKVEKSFIYSLYLDEEVEVE